jgi:hypothetical protein
VTLVSDSADCAAPQATAKETASAAEEVLAGYLPGKATVQELARARSCFEALETEDMMLA